MNIDEKNQIIQQTLNNIPLCDNIGNKPCYVLEMYESIPVITRTFKFELHVNLLKTNSLSTSYEMENLKLNVKPMDIITLYSTIPQWALRPDDPIINRYCALCVEENMFYSKQVFAHFLEELIFVSNDLYPIYKKVAELYVNRRFQGYKEEISKLMTVMSNRALTMKGDYHNYCHT